MSSAHFRGYGMAVRAPGTARIHRAEVVANRGCPGDQMTCPSGLGVLDADVPCAKVSCTWVVGSRQRPLKKTKNKKKKKNSTSKKKASFERAFLLE